MFIQFKKLSLCLVIIGSSTAALAQVSLVKKLNNIEEYQLSNGFRVVLAPQDKENKVFVNTIYFTGSLNDPKGKGGMAHLLEHLAFKGTQNVKGEEFQRRLDQYTLMTNASTDYYSTKYTNIVRPEKNALNEILYLESERMDKLILQEKFVPSELEIVKREREVRLDQPVAVLVDQIFKSVYGNQYLGRLPIGDLPELKSITMDELKQFYHTWYAPNNAMMVITGKFDKSDVLKTIDQYFSPIQKRKIPEQTKVPLLDSNQIKPRTFTVKKGSDLVKYHIYISGKHDSIQPILSLAPTLYALQPSGKLYKNIVETGIASSIQASTWLDQDMNLLFLGAVYAPSHDVNKIGTELKVGIEQKSHFSDAEINRVKTMVKNAANDIESDAASLGSYLSSYVVSKHGDWGVYYKELEQLDQLDTKQVNETLAQFLTEEHRLIGDILPTPEDQKKKATQDKTQPIKNLEQNQEDEETVLKDPSVYREEIAQFVIQSAQKIQSIEPKIQRGTLSNGMNYVLFPTSTRDDKSYATIKLDFGDEKSLFNQDVTLNLMTYLMLRGSKEHDLQQIIDQAIANDGTATVTAQSNQLVINVQAKKKDFVEFLQFIMEVIQNPSFSQSEFDLVKNQNLQALDRPYTEPDVVAGMTLSKLLEIFQPGDLRYHFDPNLMKKQFDEVTRDQVQNFYERFFITQRGQIVVTGDFESESIKKMLQDIFGTWKTSQPYQPVFSPYVAYPAQKQHVLAEPREFGNYQSILTFPVGAEHSDVPALQVIRSILAESQLSSRLAQALREKNALVYGFFGQLDFNRYIDSGALTISANYQSGRAAQVTQTIHDVLKKLIKDGVTEQEVEAAKADMMKKRVTSWDDESVIHGMLVQDIDKQKTLLKRMERDQAIARLTKADIDRAIQKYIRLDQFVEVMADQYGQPFISDKK